MMSDLESLTETKNLPALPPVLSGANTPEIERRVENFFFSIASIFEAWVNRRKSDHTRRAYRGDVMAFVEFCRFAWPEDSAKLLRVSVLDVQAFKDHVGKHGGAPKTINRRISSLSSFYKFLSGAAAELRLPITVPNPAHAQFISRESSDPVDETRALSGTQARQLMGMPSRDSLLEIRDLAIFKFYLYTGARIETGCKLNVSDFHQDGDEATLRFQFKGARAKTKGIHFSAAEAITEYIRAAGIESGPLFRPRRDAGKELLNGEKVQVCVYSPHSLRATTATLLLDTSVPIESVQDLLVHKHITATQIYDKRRRSVRDSDSHKVPI
jgi:site-specific recombinase XerD